MKTISCGGASARRWQCAIAGADAVAASAALAKLAHDPAAAVGYARSMCGPCELSRRRTSATLVVNLDSDDYNTRRRAVAELAQISAQASGALRNALKSPASLEARRRIERLLGRLHNGETNIPPGDFLRLVRVIRLLEAHRLRRSAQVAPASLQRRRARPGNRGGPGGATALEAVAAIRPREVVQPANPTDKVTSASPKSGLPHRPAGGPHPPAAGRTAARRMSSGTINGLRMPAWLPEADELVGSSY